MSRPTSLVLALTVALATAAQAQNKSPLDRVLRAQLEARAWRR